MGDVERLGEQFERRSGSLKQLMQVYKASVALEQLVEVLGKEGPNKTGDAASVDETAVEQLHERIVTPLQLASDELKKLQAMVEETIDLDSVVCLCV